ncbi:hypothetical protein DSS3PM1_00067 [Bacteriophage DSS3_PM1]|uniref:Uncharacterized protein n=1 Tax=Bacteriophage DSS3_VP1 TaxID=2664196 RepID=A0A7S5FQA9_9CAUD|nr:hypothetical protein KNU84_gp101 [Bacteriophage DSS3_VP1]QGH74603.1 hypothetical protein DSS3VP1_00035 [Bacteriophage DSS3_VP1]QGH74743.1 hypothetical protein DSS3PM1_00067 [Bacteriophage DSS3_PM1]
MKKNMKFSKAFVMDATLTHSLRAIEISRKKVYARLSELEGSNDPATAGEVLETLSILEGWKRTLEKWRDDNPQLFK